MLRMAERLPWEWEIDYEDLGNVYGRARIQSCNACVSTSMSMCVAMSLLRERQFERVRFDVETRSLWAPRPSGCVGHHRAGELVRATSNFKLMFDRLVCMNGGNPREDLIRHKNRESAMKLEHALEWSRLSLNHLEGRTAAFFCYGDGGGDELDREGRPKILHSEHRHYFNPETEPFENDRDSYAPWSGSVARGGLK
jgi:hypothetical protein